MMAASRQHLVRYAAAGLLTLAVYLTCGHVMQRLGARPGWLAIVPFALAVGLQYPLQRRWVFRDARPVRQSVGRFTVVIAAGFALNAGIVALLASDSGLLVAQLIAAVVVVGLNAVASFCWVFFRRSQPPK